MARNTLIAIGGISILACALGATAQPARPATPARYDAGALSGLGARNIGSAAMSGRISALDARVAEDGRTTIFVGAASGGVWKSVDDGTTFKPVFDDQPVQSIGAVTIDPKDPKIVWVGTGETWVRNSVSVGNGIYKSTDGGESFAYMGLPESERINRILVDPRDSNHVLACVPGKLWSDSTDRGLYATRDGGKTWTLVLKSRSPSTGCSGLTRDAKNPDVLWAGLWDFRRQGWTFRSGGDGPDAPSASAVFRSADGGATWQEITPDNTKGLPPKPWGRSEIEVAPSDSNRVYLFIESTDAALFVSDDGGKSFEKRDKSQMMVWRPFYFANIVVDPTNADRLFKMNLGLIVSEDAGRSFQNAGGGAHGDWHDIWIDPSNPKHIVGGDDGGLFISHDGGNRWWKGNNLPISQFYHVSTDDRDPYQVYGGLQDNSSWIGDSAYPGGISNARWENVYGGDGFWVFADPADPNFVYAEYQGGNIARIDRRTKAARDIQPKANFREKLRFNWNTPIHMSPNEKGTIYIGAQFLFRSRDQGQTWDRISPDLTTNDPARQQQEQSGGITVDNSSAEMHTTIFSISESPKNAAVIWVGTDDGNLQLTRDGGKTWRNVVGNVKGLPAKSWVSWVEASRHDEATAYATFDRHTVGDMTPHVFVTRDFGRTWTRIVGADDGVRGYAHVVKEDLVEPRLLFVGTEFGLFVSIDAGESWAPFKGGDFPSVAVRDIAMQSRDHDVVLATHGRGIWIIDDVTPLRQLSLATMNEEAVFLEARPVQQRIGGVGGWVEGDATFVGANPPSGAVITYYQRTRHLFGPIKLEILDADGTVIDTLPAAKRRGINRVGWNMRVGPPRVPKAAQIAFNSTQGPRVVPGTYTVRLTKGKQVLTSPLVIGLDRRAAYDADDRRAQFDAAMRVHALFGRMSTLTDRINYARMMADQIAAQLPANDKLRGQLTTFSEDADVVRKQIVATKEGGAITGEERLREHVDVLYGAIMSYEGRPAQYQVERTAALERELADIEAQYQALADKALPPIDAALKAKGLPVLSAPPPAAPTANVSSADAAAVMALLRR